LITEFLEVTGSPLAILRPAAMTAQPGDQVMIPRGFLCSSALALLLLITTAAGEEMLVEPTHATIESKEGQRLLVVFATEDRPALTLKPKGGAWDWSRESRLVIPVENPSDEALTLQLGVEDQKRRSLTGKVAIAP
jgi:P pilus assembly chaperone PapD